MSALELCNLVTYNPLALQADDSFSSCLELLEDDAFHHWPVVDDRRRLVGMLSEQDLAEVLVRPAEAVPAGGPAETAVPETCRVGDLMSRGPFAIEEKESVAAALLLMLSRGIHSLPVVSGGRLVAMLTSTDLLREFSFGQLSICRETLYDHLVACVEFVTPETTLERAERMFQRPELDCLPVMQGSCPVGLVTRRQLRRTLYRRVLKGLLCDSRGSVGEEAETAEEPTESHSVLKAISPHPPLRPGQKLSAAASVMVEHDSTAVAVVNQARRLLGVVTDDILLRLMLADLQPA